MSLNWLRYFELQLLDEKGDGLVLSDFRVTFKMQWDTLSLPRIMTLEVYNPAATMVNRVLSSELSRIRVLAGYKSELGGDNYGLIFSGDIRLATYGQENGVDKYLRIQACDGNLAYVNAFTNHTLGKGYTWNDVYEVLIDDFRQYGISKGHQSTFPPVIFPRGRPMYGDTAYLMDNLAQSCGMSWQIVDNKVQMFKQDEYAHEAVVLNSQTGLIGMPHQMLGGGVNLISLINPNIKMNGLVSIDESMIDIGELAYDDVLKAEGNIMKLSGGKSMMIPTEKAAQLSADGLYVVRTMICKGDTRGRAWYMELACDAARGKRKVTASERDSQQ